jgi:hypothetical protein
MNGMLHRRLLAVLGAALLALTSTQAAALFLSLDPSAQNASPGDPVSLDLVVSGLGDFAPDSLGAFDVDIGYDPAALVFTGYTLGSLLGDPFLFEALDLSLGDLGVVINLAEVSLLSDSELDALQPASFVLATLDFTVLTLSPGSSTLVTIDNVYAIGDAFGQPLPVDGTNDAVISNPSGNIPEPSILALMSLGLGLAGLDMARRRSKG